MNEAQVAVESVAASRCETGCDVLLDVVNGSDRARFITSDLRRLEIEPDGRRCTLWFSDAGREGVDDEPGVRHQSLPHTVALEPGEHRELRVTIPEIVNRLVIAADGTWDVERVDLRQLATVDVRVSVAAAPFYFNPNEPSVTRQLAAWGEVIGATAEVAHDDDRGGPAAH